MPIKLTTIMITRFIVNLIYCCWSYLAFIIVIIPGYLLVTLSPKLSYRQAFCKMTAQALLLLMGQKITNASDNLIPRNALILINHTSYIDAVIMRASLPKDTSFLIKDEVNTVPLVGLFLRRIDSIFVKRKSRSSRADSLLAIRTKLKTGGRVALFPEGTFSKNPGIKKFHLSSISVAHEEKVPIVSMAISGARKMLTSGSWFLKYSRLSLTFDQLIRPEEFKEPLVMAENIRNNFSKITGEELLNG